MIGDQRANGRERGVSVAITHVLTIGITTILIAMLMMSGSTLLETETERSTDRSLETIGERLANEIENVDRIVNEDGTSSVSLTVEHPRAVTNAGYTVELLDVSECDAADTPLIEADVSCLELTSHSENVVVHVPVAVDVDTFEGRATGGTIAIEGEKDPTSGDITLSIEGAN